MFTLFMYINFLIIHYKLLFNKVDTFYKSVTTAIHPMGV